MSESLDITPELAKRLVHEGAYCICLGVPPGTEFGVDMKSWKTGDKFNGVKMIPPGIHYIHYSGTNKHGDMAPRQGFVYNFKKSEVVAKEWNSANEELEEVNAVQKERLKANLQNLDRFLGPYPFDNWSSWKELSDRITPLLVEKFIPVCGTIKSALDLTGTEDSFKKENMTKRCMSKPFSDVKDDLQLPQLKAAEGTEIRFTKVPETCYPEGSSPSEVTQHSLDSSYLLNQLFMQHDSPDDLVGEIQFSFVCFLIGHSLDAFDHWKHLVGIMCACDTIVSKHRTVFSDFLTVLHHQIQHVPQDFLVDIVASQNFIYQSLRKLFRTLQSNELDGRLKSKAKRFQESLTQKFMWDFSDILEDDEEDRPVVVET